jgi:hypothetical protein
MTNDGETTHIKTHHLRPNDGVTRTITRYYALFPFDRTGEQESANLLFVGSIPTGASERQPEAASGELTGTTKPQ